MWNVLISDKCSHNQKIMFFWRSFVRHTWETALKKKKIMKKEIFVPFSGLKMCIMCLWKIHLHKRGKKIFIKKKKGNYKIHKYYDDKKKEKCEKDFLKAKRVEITEKRKEVCTVRKSKCNNKLCALHFPFVSYTQQKRKSNKKIIGAIKNGREEKERKETYEGYLLNSEGRKISHSLI